MRHNDWQCWPRWVNTLEAAGGIHVIMHVLQDLPYRQSSRLLSVAFGVKVKK